MKRCPRCDELKPLGEFNRNTKRGRQHYCRPCQVDHWRNWDRERRQTAPHERSTPT